MNLILRLPLWILARTAQPLWASLGAQRAKNLPAMQETWVQSLGGEESLESGVATHSKILVWRIPWAEEPGRLQLMGCKELDSTEQLTHTQSSTLVKF